MIELNKNYRLSCTLESCSILELQQFPERLKGCYQLIVHPWDYFIREEWDLIFSEEAGPHVEVDTSEIYAPKDLLILESIVKPYSPDFSDYEKDLQPGTDLEVTITPELKGNEEHKYAQLTIMFVDKPNTKASDTEYWDNYTGPEYSF